MGYLLQDENFPDHHGIVVVDERKRVLFVDDKAAALLQASPSVLMGKSCDDLQSLFPCASSSCIGKEYCPQLQIRPQLQERGKRTSPLTAENTRKGESNWNAQVAFETRIIEDHQGTPRGLVHIVTSPPLTEVQERLPAFEGIVGAAPSMIALFHQLTLVAPTEVSVNIQGESGTGKERIVEALHTLSERQGKLVKVHCSSIPSSLLESTLFGHVRGAFTGAVRDASGLIAAAEGGTLFLDEIGEISLDIQVKLLRFLQSKEYHRVGDPRPKIASVRIVTATHRNLSELVREGKFREDFFYRISVFPLTVPPLRERTSDIPLLVNKFIEKFNHQFQRNISGVDAEAMALLQAYYWPGNVRELEHALEHAFVKCTQGNITPAHLPSVLSQKKETVLPQARIQEDKKTDIEHALAQTQGNMTDAAALLGVSRVTLWKWMKKEGIVSRNVKIQ